MLSIPLKPWEINQYSIPHSLYAILICEMSRKSLIKMICLLPKRPKNQTVLFGVICNLVEMVGLHLFYTYKLYCT